MHFLIHSQQVFFDWFQVFYPIHIYSVLGGMLFSLIFSSKFWFGITLNYCTWIFPFFISSLSIFLGLLSYDFTYNIINMNIENSYIAIFIHILAFSLPSVFVGILFAVIIKLKKTSLIYAIFLTIICTGIGGYVTKSVIHTFEGVRQNIEDKRAPEQEIPY